MAGTSRASSAFWTKHPKPRPAWYSLVFYLAPHPARGTRQTPHGALGLTPMACPVAQWRGPGPGRVASHPSSRVMQSGGGCTHLLRGLLRRLLREASGPLLLVSPHLPFSASVGCCAPPVLSHAGQRANTPCMKGTSLLAWIPRLTFLHAGVASCWRSTVNADRDCTLGMQ